MRTGRRSRFCPSVRPRRRRSRISSPYRANLCAGLRACHGRRTRARIDRRAHALRPRQRREGSAISRPANTTAVGKQRPGNIHRPGRQVSSINCGLLATRAAPACAGARPSIIPALREGFAAAVKLPRKLSRIVSGESRHASRSAISAVAIGREARPRWQAGATGGGKDQHNDGGRIARSPRSLFSAKVRSSTRRQQAGTGKQASIVTAAAVPRWRRRGASPRAMTPAT